MAVRKAGGWIGAVLSLFGRNIITLFGASLTTASVIAIIAFLILGALNVVDMLYVGIVAFLVLPGFFILGLLLIPFGAWWEHRRRVRAGESAPERPRYPTLDLNRPQVRRALAIIGILTAVNLLILSTVSYGGVHYMESPQFCGQVCHSVMAPEYASYVDSPHARVACVECHIGPGAPWFVRSKLSGAGQVIAVLLDTYHKPIKTPVDNLRPSQDTCEQCHWPERFTGDRIKVFTKFEEDEANTATRTALLMHVGGAQGRGHGIHSWHIDPTKETTYYTDDPKRLHIPVVRVKEADGTVTEYVSAEYEGKEIDLSKMEARRMDCIDCHSRPTHIFYMPNQAMDKALAEGAIDRKLPSIKRVGTEALRAADGLVPEGTDPYDLEAAEALRQQQLQEIAETVRGYYRENHADAYAELEPAIEQAIAAMQDIYRRNIFPEMDVTWGTYRSHIGHNEEDYPPLESPGDYVPAYGCFRCHDEAHATRDGAKVISQDCTICHSFLDDAALTELGVVDPLAAEAAEEDAAAEPADEMADEAAEAMPETEEAAAETEAAAEAEEEAAE